MIVFRNFITIITILIMYIVYIVKRFKKICFSAKDLEYKGYNS